MMNFFKKLSILHLLIVFSCIVAPFSLKASQELKKILKEDEEKQAITVMVPSHKKQKIDLVSDNSILSKEVFSVRVLGLDVETSGSSFVRNGILSIGCSLQDENSSEEASFRINISLPKDREYEEDCLLNFWQKYPEAHKLAQINAKAPKEAMTEFCQFLDFIEEKYPDIMLVSDNPSFDIAWINTYLSSYTERKPLNYSSSGMYRMIWDSASAQKTWMSIKTGDFKSRHGHIKKLGFTSKWEHDHTALNDARRTTDFFNQARKEMQDFVGNKLRKVEVVPYNQEWNLMFEDEASLLRKALDSDCVNVYHVGSTSVPELAAKPIIDIIVELNEDAKLVADKLISIGYQYKGEFNIPMRHFFGKKTPFEVNLHVYEKGNPEIELNIGFRDFLRKSELHRLRYEVLKMKLVNDPSSHEKVGGFTKYSLGKDKFITDIIAQTGFSGICPRFCTHYAEWEKYHQIRESLLSNYDRKDSIYTSTEDHHLVLYKGIEIIGAAHINAPKYGDISELKFFHIEDPFGKSELEKNFSLFLEKWSASKGRKLAWK